MRREYTSDNSVGSDLSELIEHDSSFITVHNDIDFVLLFAEGYLVTDGARGLLSTGNTEKRIRDFLYLHPFRSSCALNCQDPIKVKNASKLLS